MGIDIRDGDQLECINCALCIDACDDVMRRVDLPSGLIAYDTYENVDRRARGEKAHHRWVRPRVMLYATAIALVGAVMLVGLSTRASLDLSVARERNPTFVRLSDGSIRNAYLIKIMNRANEPRSFVLAFEGPQGATVRAIGVAQGDALTVAVEPDRLRTLRVLVTAPPGAPARASVPVNFSARDVRTGETQTAASVFLSDGGPR
jgi:polyferredoxin